jgi:hypothetical protein
MKYNVNISAFDGFYYVKRNTSYTTPIVSFKKDCQSTICLGSRNYLLVL